MLLRRDFLLSISAACLAAVSARPAHSAGRVRLGWITAQREASLQPYLTAFRAGLAALGYVEGTNLSIQYAYGDDHLERVPELTTRLIDDGIDVLVAQGAAVAKLRQTGVKVPVVYVFSGDPVSAGLAESLAKPTGDMTGLTFMAAEFNGKRLQILQEIVPDLRRVAVLGNPEHPGSEIERDFCEDYGSKLGIAVKFVPTRTESELIAALAGMGADPPQAISVLADGFAVQNRQRIIEFGMGHRVPVISGWPVFARSGAVCSYGPRLTDSYRRLAAYVDRVLKGSKPGELPIERPTTFELVLNRRTARELGIELSPSLVVGADEIID